MWEDELIPGRFAQPPMGCWVVSNSQDVVQRVLNVNATLRKMADLRRRAAAWVRRALCDRMAHRLSNLRRVALEISL